MHHEVADRIGPLLNDANRLSFSPRVHWKDPFSAGTCLCYWSAALTLLFLPRITHYRYMPEQTAVSGLLLLVLAGGSLGFHADGSMKGWRYWADMYTIFLYFFYVAVNAPIATANAYAHYKGNPRVLNDMGQPDLDSGAPGLVALLFKAVSLSALPFFILYAPEVQQNMDLLLICAGFIIYTSNAASWFILGLGLSSSRLMGVFAALSNLLSSLIPLAIGRVLNTHADNLLGQVGRDHSLSTEVRRAMRMKYDLMHGTWHLFATLSLIGMVLSMLVACDGRLHEADGWQPVPQAWQPVRLGARLYKTDSHMFVPDVIASTYLCLLPFFFLAMYAAGASADAWLSSWLVVASISVPGLCALFSHVQRAHRRKLRSIVDAERTRVTA